MIAMLPAALLGTALLRPVSTTVDTTSGPREEEVLIEGRDGRHLAGTLTVPATGPPPFPVAVSLTGSGPHYRDGNRTPTHPYRPFRETMRYQHAYDIELDRSIPAERKAAVLQERMAQQERNVATSREKWRQWSQDRDPLPTARRVRCPVLILQGLTDRAVSPDEARHP